MTTIEVRLRASLAYQVREPRSGEDMAGKAIRAGRAIRRRRMVAAAAACVVVTAGVACVRPGGGVAPTATPQSPAAVVPVGQAQLDTAAESTGTVYGVHLDVFEQPMNQLRTVEGQRFDL